MRCVAPMELNCTMQLHCYKGLAPPELHIKFRIVIRILAFCNVLHIRSYNQAP